MPSLSLVYKLNMKFIIVYDSDNTKHCAKSMMSYVSERNDIKSVLLTSENVKSQLDNISTECYLYIGSVCSKCLDWVSQYDNYGIQIGWKGRRAWIRVHKRFIPNENFWSDYVRLYKEMNVVGYDSDIDDNSIEESVRIKIKKWVGKPQFLTTDNHIKRHLYKYAELLFEKEYLGAFVQNVQDISDVNNSLRER